MKLGFVDGTIVKPSRNSNSPEVVHWNIVDNMVYCWILNSMTLELSHGFLYA